MSDPPVHLVLDASAVRAYPSIHLGETLTGRGERRSSAGSRARAALLIATVYRCHSFTGRPEWYAALGDDPPIVRF